MNELNTYNHISTLLNTTEIIGFFQIFHIFNNCYFV